MCLGRHNCKEAIKYFEKALEIDPYHTNSLVAKGTTLDILKRYDEAIECYEKVLEIDPNDIPLGITRGLHLWN